jgi:transposase
VITDPTVMNLYFFNLEDVSVLGIENNAAIPEVHVELARTAVGCPTCGVIATVKDRHRVSLADLSMAGRQICLVWNKRRFKCAEVDCPTGTWTEIDERIAAPRLKMTDRAGRWATLEVGYNGRSVTEVAEHLGCDWHTVNDAVLAYGSALVDHPERFGDVTSLGLDEHLMVRVVERHTKHFVTAIVDVERAQLLDIVPDRKADEPKAWLGARGEEWLSHVTSGTLDLSATYHSVFAAVLAHAQLVADPFHVVRHATHQVDLARRRVQNETFGHRGRQGDPLYRARRPLTMAAERLDEEGTEKLLGLVRAGNRYGQVQATWTAKEAVRELYAVEDYDLAGQFIDELIRDMADKT